MRTHYNLKKTCPILIVIFVILLQSCSSDRGNDSDDTSRSKKILFFSGKFSHRFDLQQSDVLKNWSDTIAVSVEKSLTNPEPAMACKVTLYVGEDVKFSYPQVGDYTNILGDDYNALFYFSAKLNNEDSRYITKNTLKGANKLVLKQFNDDAKVVGMNSLLIETVSRNIVEGIHVIKTYPIPCVFFENKKYLLKLLFLDSVKDGELTRTETINAYELPIAKLGWSS